MEEVHEQSIFQVYLNTLYYFINLILFKNP